MSTPDFFAELKEWSERKLTIIKKYVDAASRILGSFDPLYYVDGFAGRGNYGTDATGFTEGSPLQAAKYAEELRAQGKTYRLHCINVEIDRANFDQLCALTSPFSSVTTNYLGEFVDYVPSIIGIVRAKPVVCFIDPFGVKGMDLNALEEFIKRDAITDLWIRLDVNEVFRRDGYYERTEPGADKQFDIIMRVFGYTDAAALHRDLGIPDSLGRHELALDLYRNRVRMLFEAHQGKGFVESYPIRSITGEHKYDLICATANPKAIVLSSNIVHDVEANYQYDVEWYKKNQPDFQPSLFDDTEPTVIEIDNLKAEKLSDRIAASFAGQIISRNEIHAAMVHNNFGGFKRPHMTKALKLLDARGKIGSHSGLLSDEDTVISFT